MVSVYGSGLALYNDPEPTKRITRVFRETFGKENVIDPGRIMGSEDFANFGTVEPKILLTYFAIGVIDPKVYKARVKEDKLPPSPHNPHFAPSLSSLELTIETDVKAMTVAALDLFGKK